MVTDSKLSLVIPENLEMLADKPGQQIGYLTVSSNPQLVGVA